ncbi:hypothetical protein [Sphingomonas sp.]|uniref:hypothetical protein n=1 Tax=Sphingomonas sp. TaxID=28214 RepID=UPI002EDAFE26
MGWPGFKPANDCLAFTSGKEMDVETGMEIAHIATMLGKDVIYAGWSSTKAPRPSGFTVGYRMMFSIDIVDKLLPYAANDTASLTLVNTRADEFFAIDQRGSLVRAPGKPKDIRKGRELAMKRIRERAATMDGALLPTNRFVPTGQGWIEPDVASVETVVRFA